MQVDLDPTIHLVSSNEHGEASASRIYQDGRSNDAQGHSHEDGATNSDEQARPNSTIKKEVKTTLHKLMVLILQSIMTMMMKMMAPSKDQLKCHTQEYINPFNGITSLITYWEAFDKG
jgi:hypothetical protein